MSIIGENSLKDMGTRREGGRRRRRSDKLLGGNI